MSRRASRRFPVGNGGGERLRGRLRPCFSAQPFLGLYRLPLRPPRLGRGIQHALDHRIRAARRLGLAELIAVIFHGESSMSGSDDTPDLKNSKEARPRTVSTTLDAAAVDPKIAIPDDIACCYGHFSIKWARVESLVEEIIWHLAGLDSVKGAVFTSDQQYQYRTRLLCALLNIANVPSIAAKWHTASTMLQPLYDQRNIMSHSVWMYIDETIILIGSRIGQGDAAFESRRQGVATKTRLSLTLPELQQWIKNEDDALSLLTEILRDLDARVP